MIPYTWLGPLRTLATVLVVTVGEQAVPEGTGVADGNSGMGVKEGVAEFSMTAVGDSVGALPGMLQASIARTRKRTGKNRLFFTGMIS